MKGMGPQPSPIRCAEGPRAVPGEAAGEGSAAAETRIRGIPLARWIRLPATSAFMGVYLAVGAILMQAYPCSITTDTPSYVSIAAKYSEGRIQEAVNWMWSPLISWLLVPFLRLGIEPLDAIKVLGLAAGAVGFLALRRIFRDLGFPDTVQGLLALAMAPMFYAFGLTNPNPDLLVAVILIVYMQRVLAPDFGARRWDGPACGLLGALAYFAKAYAFPFFAVHFPLVSLWRHAGETDPRRRRDIRLCLLLGVLTFLSVCSPWIAALSVKYDRLTISAAGTYNFRLVHQSPTANFLEEGFALPPDDRALSAWEDPPGLAASRWEPIDPARSGRDTVIRTVANVLATVDALQAGSVFSAAILAFALFRLLGLPRRELLQDPASLLLLSLAVHPLGYLPLLVDRRYLYLDIFLLLILGACLLHRLLPETPPRRLAAIALLCLSFALTPVRDLRANLFINEGLREHAETLRAGGVAGNIGSNGNYDASLYIAYFLSRTGEVRYLGVSRPPAAVEFARALREYRIDYYLCWPDRPCPMDADIPATKAVELPGLRVFRTGWGTGRNAEAAPHNPRT
ncbi:MAG: hypothetical protein HPY67_12600 [Syntrophaceae bacterium]|nr:hypothetical protein [Syntrophaceae bacterium]